MDNAGSYYISEGVSQQDRYPAALSPDYFQIDERTVDDLLLFIVELSYQYNYFDNSNTLNGDWSDFFMTDANLQLRIFPHFDFKKYFIEYDRRKQELALAVNEDELKSRLKNLAEWISGDFLNLQRGMYENFITSITGKNEDKLKEVTNLVGSAKEYFESIDKFSSVLDTIQGATGIEYEGLDAALKIFDDLFLQFEIMHNRLVKASNYFFQKLPPGMLSYKPHISLVIAFLELYQRLKSELNQYTGKHLDFYYNRVLGFEPKGAVTDKVSVVLKLNKGTNEFLLRTGEKLAATIPGQATKEIFSLSEDILVNLAEIVELKTIYKHTYYNFLDLGEEFQPIKEYMIYAADNPVVSPADFIKKKYPDMAWPLFGQNQRYLPTNEQSMKEVDVGIMISSALLFVQDGKRYFSIKFHLNPLHFSRSFYKLAGDYEKATGISKRVIISEMLKKAFVVHITGAEQWIRITEYSTLCPLDDALDNFIDVRFELGPDDPAVAVYQPGIHGTGIDTRFPVVRLMLNPTSFQNSYTFLFEQVIERITIHVNVKDSARLKLQNNIGPLSASVPMQVFGPLPAVGSYLCIKNTNIFNRFTTDFTIKLKWFDLPKNKDGFKDYYGAYSNDINNDSFKVTVSELNNDNYMKPEEQVVFNLFEMNKQAGLKQYLCDTTTFEMNNSHKIHFENEPLLAGEEEDGMDFKGTIRIELIAPANAFYHKSYPVIFPEILMNNSKRFAKKLPIPNQPFTPIVRSVVADYTLQHSEAISAKNEDGETDIALWHIHPFGVKKTYRPQKKETVHFFPSITHESNLYIGLINVEPGKILTLLFQMEESITPGLEEKTEPIFWSYLDQNEWKNINASDILEDNTIDFKDTGIVRIVLPENISKGNTILNPDLYWIRISTEGFIGSGVKAIFTQVVTARRQLDPLETNSGSLTLLPNMIHEFSRKIPEILNVYQPFPSYHGRPGETKDQFYTWVSEHLNHKQRMITSSDISRKILELFPEIHKVICYSNTETNVTGHAGDDLQVIVIPKIKSIDGDAAVDPRVNIYTLYKIRNYINENISPFLNVNVRNPEYERIKVFCSVIFTDIYKDRSNGFLIQKLNREIRKFISPWLFSEEVELNENKGIYPSEILNFIKQLPYINFVSGFTVVHFYYHYNRKNGSKQARILDSTALNFKQEKSSFMFTGKKAANIKLLFKGSKPGSIIISAEEHTINVIPKKINKAVINKDDEVKPPKTGIGNLVVGHEFLVMDPYDISDYPGVTGPPEKNDEDEVDFYYNANA